MQKIFKTAGMLVLLLFTVSSLSAVPTPTSNDKKLTLEQLKLFGDIFERVRASYVEPVEDEKLIEYAINGMLSGLDPHSSYLNAENFKEIKMHTKGEFGGLGMELTLDRGLIKVLSPIDDTPAFKAGIQPGDYITAVDGQSIIGLGFSDAVKMMRGEPNTSITLTIVRQDTQDPIEIKMKRAIIKVNPVRAQLYDDILYLRIASFTEKTASSLKDEIKKYITEVEQKASAKGILLDLRNNPGGLLEQAIEVSDVFLPAGEIVSTKGRNKEDVKRYNASGKNLVNNIPMVILINGGTASASEIVAGALQDHKKALIVGTRSFGKGSVQSIVPFQNNVAIRLTIARYYTPSGRSIQAEGIMPDVLLDSAKIEFVNNNKFSYKEVDLPKHLQNKQSEKKPEEEFSRIRQGIYANDYQLGMAYDIVKSIVIYRAM